MADNKSWMPMAAGILEIICGAWAILFSFALVLFASLFKTLAIPDMPAFLGPLIGIMSIPFALVGILAIVGGVFSIRKKIWGLALAGAIVSIFAPYMILLAIAAIVFVALSKEQFA
jgi:hypothetical protein